MSDQDHATPSNTDDDIVIVIKRFRSGRIEIRNIGMEDLTINEADISMLDEMFAHLERRVPDVATIICQGGACSDTIQRNEPMPVVNTVDDACRVTGHVKAYFTDSRLLSAFLKNAAAERTAWATQFAHGAKLGDRIRSPFDSNRVHRRHIRRTKTRRK